MRDGYLPGLRNMNSTTTFFFLLLCLYIQMPVAGCDCLPCCATMLRRPLPFCAGQLHHGNLYGCWSAAHWLVIKVML